MPVIDLRENPVQQMQIAQGMGQSIAGVINQFKKTQMEKHILQTLNDPTLKAEQRHQRLLQIGGILDTQLGQEVAQMQSGTGRYYRSPYQQQLEQANLDRTRALTNWYQTRAQNPTGSTAASARDWTQYTGTLKLFNDISDQLNNSIRDQKGLKIPQSKIDDLTRQKEVLAGRLKQLQTELGIPAPRQDTSQVDAITMASPSITPGIATSAPAPGPTTPKRELAPLTDEQARRNARPIASKEEYDALPPGSYFIAPNGELRQKNG